MWIKFLNLLGYEPKHKVKRSLSQHMIAVKDHSGQLKHFDVPMEVYVYIIQLEMEIKHPTESKLKELYPNRFKNKFKKV